MDFAVGVCGISVLAWIIIIGCYLVWHKRYDDTLRNMGIPEEEMYKKDNIRLQVRWFMYLSFIAGCITFPTVVCWLYILIETVTKH